jgi:hypothetical protein
MIEDLKQPKLPTVQIESGKINNLRELESSLTKLYISKIKECYLKILTIGECEQLKQLGLESDAVRPFTEDKIDSIQGFMTYEFAFEKFYIKVFRNNAGIVHYILSISTPSEDSTSILNQEFKFNSYASILTTKQYTSTKFVNPAGKDSFMSSDEPEYNKEFRNKTLALGLCKIDNAINLALSD